MTTDPTSPPARLLTLLSLLQARRDWPGETLAGRLGVSARTVRRDVDRLRELGYPVKATKGPDGGYRLEAGTHMPPLLLDDEQAVAVTVALQTASTGIDGVDEAALRALTTVRQVMPARLRSRVDALQVTAVDRPGPRTTVDAERLVLLGAAVRAREVVRFDYAAPSGDDGGSAPVERAPQPPRRTEPHHLVTWNSRWYLVGWDLDRADWRTYRVDRMDPRTVTGPRFTPRELPAPDVATYVAERFSRIPPPCTGEVVLHADADHVARWAGRRTVVEPLDHGRCRVVASSWSWTGLIAWLAMFGADIEVTGPEELRDAAQQLSARLARAV